MSGLRIAALLPPPLQLRLLAAVEQLPQTIVCLLPGSQGLSRLHNTVSLVVVDPVCGGQALVTNISHLLHRPPTWPLLVYTTVTPIIATLGRQGLREVVLTPYDDSPERFARTLQRMATTARDAHP